MIKVLIDGRQTFWKNFLISIEPNQYITNRDRILKEYHAYLESTNGKANNLVFATEQDATFFILRWS